LSWLQKRLVALAHGGRANNELNFRASEFMKTYIVINCLPQLGPTPNSITTISNVLVFKKPHSAFDFSNGASYIDPFVDVKMLDILFNNITIDTMSCKLSWEPWRGGKERSLIVIQQLIEVCSPPEGHILDLFNATSEYQLCVGFLPRLKFLHDLH
jgi:hypothetical protein